MPVISTFRLLLAGATAGGVMVGLVGGTVAAAERSPDRDDTTTISSHEPTLLGWTYDDSGDGYMDFTLSAKFPLFPSLMTYISDNSSLYFAFTGRFGQYFNRNSSPVIGKRFNPELFYRHYLQGGARADVGYAHESNGQQINSLASYQEAQRTLEQPEYADDYISRGWDYWRFTVRSQCYPVVSDTHWTTAQFTGKLFLQDGILQGEPEEYNAWENSPEGKPRKEVDGLSVLLKYHAQGRCLPEKASSTGKLTLVYTTGYSEIFRYNTVRLEAGVRLGDLPVILWVSRGYNSDLVRYYKNVDAAGIAVEIGAF